MCSAPAIVGDARHDAQDAWLWQRARLTPHAAALRFERDGSEESPALDYAALAREAETAALRLLALGVARGDRIAVHMASHPRLVALLHAAQKLGAVLVPLNTRLPSCELTPLLEHAAPRLLLADDVAPLANVFHGVDCIDVHRDFDRVPIAKSAILPPHIDPGAPWMIVYTSGTTALPKGVVLSNANHFAAAAGSRQRLGHGAGEVWLATLPLYHVGGLAILARAVLEGSRVDLSSGFDAARVRRVIENGPATMISLVPTMLARLLEMPPAAHSKLRCLLIGGAALSPALARRALESGLPIAVTYGLSEACSQVCTTLPGSTDATDGSVGTALSCVGVRIDSPADDGIGELLVRGPNVTSRYFRNDAANTAAFAEPPVAPAPGASLPQQADLHVGRWLRTGDLASIDAQGRVHIACRRSDLIVSGGENIVPSQVETVLEEHPAVRECAVFGIDDPEWGQRVIALVAPRVDHSMDVADVTAELTAWCRERLAAYKTPRVFRFVHALPRNATGKVDRRALPEAWEAARPAGERS